MTADSAHFIMCRSEESSKGGQWSHMLYLKMKEKAKKRTDTALAWAVLCANPLRGRILCECVCIRKGTGAHVAYLSLNVLRDWALVALIVRFPRHYSCSCLRATTGKSLESRPSCGLKNNCFCLLRSP